MAMNAVGVESPSLPGQDYSTLVPSEAVSVETAFERAGLLHEQGKFDQAEQLYQAILQIDPDHVSSLYNLGILCFQWGRYDDTVALINKVVRLRPDLAAAHNAMGVALKHLGSAGGRGLLPRGPAYRARICRGAQHPG
jgi:tetratricopeptide (TPR) repeat protein